jgi:DNA invertase Pin-like site-specific DNA recombinase
MNTQRSTNGNKVAVGYVRVSTQEQVSEGVSLDAQRDKLKAYCKCSGIKLIDIKADEGLSGGTLERPGLQAALAMLRRGTANTLIVVKLDRLSRSLRDVCTLVEDYFGNERYHLLSLCGMANTHSAAGRMVLMNLANYAQFEREMISERTRDALRHMKAQGVRLGPAPYGYALSDEVDANGRRLLVPIPDEQEVIRKIKSLRAEGLSFAKIAQRLNDVRTPARRNGTWRVNRICIILHREGMHTMRKNRPHVPSRFDPEAATALAVELRKEGFSLSQIGARLRKAKLTPQRGGKWYPAQVAKLLQGSGANDREAAARRAAEWRAEGMTLKEIGVRLAMEGCQTRDGGIWHPATVVNLISSIETTDPASSRL